MDPNDPRYTDPSLLVATPWLKKSVNVCKAVSCPPDNPILWCITRIIVISQKTGEILHEEYIGQENRCVDDYKPGDYPGENRVVVHWDCFCYCIPESL